MCFCGVYILHPTAQCTGTPTHRHLSKHCPEVPAHRHSELGKQPQKVPAHTVLKHTLYRVTVYRYTGTLHLVHTPKPITEQSAQSATQ